jgi:hypothetical protein
MSDTSADCSPMKVLGFDAWARGIHHYERLANAFRKRGLELKLIHLGSWGNEKGRPEEEVLGSVQVRDISFYRRRTFQDILELERPSAVIFLSTEAFAHRAFNRYCRRNHVPTIHLFHGLHSATNSEDDVSIEIHKRLWILRAHVPKLLVHFLPVYARSLRDTGATIDEWQQFGMDVLNRFCGRYTKEAAKDSKANRACVYINSDIKHAIERYGYSEEEVSAVGNPDLSFFGMPSSAVGSLLHRKSNSERVMYIDSGLVDVGFAYESQDEFIGHMIHTNRELLRQGKRLSFKPHYIHRGTKVVTETANAGIRICSNEEFVEQLQECCACIVEPSSLAVIPALMGMPLFLAQYGKLGEHRFGELLTTYPRTRPLPDLSRLASLLKEEETIVDFLQIKEWIDKNSGPLPAEDMPNRVAEVVLSLIQELRFASGLNLNQRAFEQTI